MSHYRSLQMNPITAALRFSRRGANFCYGYCLIKDYSSSEGVGRESEKCTTTSSRPVTGSQPRMRCSLGWSHCPHPVLKVFASRHPRWAFGELTRAHIAPGTNPLLRAAALAARISCLLLIKRAMPGKASHISWNSAINFSLSSIIGFHLLINQVCALSPGAV